VREAGYKVYYQPKSVVIHHEGITSGKDLTSGTKKHQVDNKKKFLSKWKPVLELKHWFPDPAFAVRAKWHGMQPTVLIVDSVVPEQDKDAGSVRMHNIIQLLMDKGFRVTLFPESKQEAVYPQYYMNLGIEVVKHSPCFEAFIAERLLQFDFVWLARPNTSFNKLDIIRKLQPNIKIVYDTVDLHFVRTGRQSKIDQSDNMAEHSNVYQAEEIYLCRHADVAVVVTAVEMEVLKSIDICIDTAIIPHILKIPEQQLIKFEERKGLMFLGGYRHTPNIDAVIWFANEILPIIRRSISDAVFYVIGSHPPEAILALQKAGEIEVIGWVKDLDYWFNKSRVFISPLRYGAGGKGKNIQAMGYGLPMVTTSIGAEGLNLQNRENALIDDTAEGFAQAVIELYQTSSLWQDISVNSIAHFNKNYSNSQAETQLEALYMRLFGSNNAEDFIRPDIRKLLMQLDDKNDVIELRKAFFLNMLKQGIDRPIFIWGAGFFGKRSSAVLREVDVIVEGFVDSDSAIHGETVDSLTVYSPDILMDTHGIKPFVVIGVSLPYRKEIEAQLRDNGYFEEQDFCVCQDFLNVY